MLLNAYKIILKNTGNGTEIIKIVITTIIIIIVFLWL